MSPTDEIKARINLTDYISRFVDLKRAGSYEKALCPFHDEKTPSFMVSEERQSWKCYGCNAGGDIFDFAQQYHGWDFREALVELAREAGVKLKERSPDQRASDDQAKLLTAMLEHSAERYYRALTAWAGGAGALTYIEGKRGISRDVIDLFGLGYAPDQWTRMTDHLTGVGYDAQDVVASGLARQSDSGRVYDLFRGRLMIPIRDHRGRVVSFAGRALESDQEPKYLNGPQSSVFDKGRVLFGFYEAREAIRASGEVFVVEGYLDVLALQTNGVQNVVAQMGTALTKTHVHELSRIADRVILALDGDTAGREATDRDARLLIEQEVDAWVMIMPDGCDPDDMAEQWGDLSRMTIVDYLIDSRTKNLPDDASVIQRKRIAEDLLPLLTAAETNLYRLDNVQRLAARLNLPEREVVRMSQPSAPKPTVKAVEMDTEPSPIQSYCIRSVIDEPMRYYWCQRAFREIGVEPLNAGDFTGDYARVWRLLEAAVEQDSMSVRDYMVSHVDRSLYGLMRSNDEPLTDEGYVYNARHLRLMRLKQEADHLIALGDYDAVTERNIERRRLMVESKTVSRRS